MRRFDTLIVGGGHGGAQAAIALRQGGYAGSIAIAGREAELPYERPPLSKDYLSGDKPWERMLIRPPAFWAERDVAMLGPAMGGVDVTSVDPAAKTVATNGGDQLAYGNLIWAAGGDARKLDCPGGELRGVHTVRNRADVEAIMAELDRVGHIVVIGGGYIGLEAAAVLRKLGKAVTLVEALPRVLARVAGFELSAFIEGEHRNHGVDLLTGTGVAALADTDGLVAGVILADGRHIPADMVIVGIGIIPCVAPLIVAGAAGALNGVLVDAFCRTSQRHIWAIGDGAAQASRFAHGEWGGGELARIESVQNANDQATTAAKDILGQPRPHTSTPWFWSNQYDLKLQSVGLNAGHDQTVVRGDIFNRSFSVIYLRNRRVIALDCVNMVRDYAQGRKLVEAAVVADIAALADINVPLKLLLPPAAD